MITSSLAMVVVGMGLWYGLCVVTAKMLFPYGL